MIHTLTTAIDHFPNHSIELSQSFSSNQIKSKEFLCKLINNETYNSICFLGGWFCSIPPLLLNGNKSIISIDINPLYAAIKLHESVEYITMDVNEYSPKANIVVNTSFEHMSDETHDIIFSKCNSAQKIYVMSNNMYHVKEHINCDKTLDDFIQHISKWMCVDESYEIPLKRDNKRYLVVGYV